VREQINYIRHLTSFYEKLKTDDRFTPAHVSLYLALFQCWNMNHFENPISANRAQVLRLCKIGSGHTYYKALKDLCNWGYIQYDPSFSPVKGSLINLCIFAPVAPENDSNSEQQLCKNDIGSCAEMHQDLCKIDIATCAKMHPSLNNININNKTYCGENTKTENLNSEDMKSNNQSIGTINKSKRKKVAQKKEKVMQPPELEKVIPFFRMEGFSEIEARKFFNHFESNGWRVGGKSPMKNWHAAARNWMLNIQKFNPNFKGTSRNLNNTKNYGEPL
jgi:hypothetical protein